MGYVVIYRDNQGRVTYLNKLFDSENSAFEFVKSHQISDYEICSQEEFQAYLAEQQQQSQQTGYQQGYQQSVTQPEYELPRRDMSYKTPYKPAFFKPAFIGKKIRR